MEQEKKKINVKIIVPIVIAIVVIAVVGIVAITNSGMSKDKMLEVAEELNETTFVEDIRGNQARAKEQYNNKVFTYTTYVASIESNYVIMGKGNCQIKVYLNNEDTKRIEVGQRIKVVGKLDNIQLEKEGHTAGGTSYTTEKGTGDMKKAYLTETTFDINGIVKDITDYNYYSQDYYTKKYTYKTRTEKEKKEIWQCDVSGSDKITYCLNECIPVENRKFKGEVGKTTIGGKEIEEMTVVEFKGATVISKDGKAYITKFNSINVR